MKRIRKGLAILATLAMVMSLGVSTAFAAPISDGVATTTDTQLTIPKGVTFINKDAVTSYGPGITYTYTVAPATVEDGTMTVKDAAGNATTVHSGPTGGLTLDASSITFGSSETFTTSATGVQATKNIVLNFDASKFARAGVYRYVLTDTTATSALYAAGIVRDDNYDTTRFIDVFVKRNATTGAMEVYGYALKTDNSSTGSSATPATAKDPGFVSESPAEDGTTVKTDRYTTYNVTLTKIVAGALGDTAHEFPFAVTVSNDGKNYYAAKGDINAAKAATADAATSKATALKHKETYTLAGLSPHATVAYQETNDTTDLYDVTASDMMGALTVTDDAAKTYAVPSGAVSSYDELNSITDVSAQDGPTGYMAVTYTNTLNEVSPTGFIQHFGMILMLLSAGIMFILVSSKMTEDEEM